MPPPQQYFLRENLRLRLLSARIALLSHDDASFQGRRDAANAWVKQYFDTRAKPVQALSATLDAARRRRRCQPTCPTSPPASTALRTVKAGRERRAERRRQRACHRPAAAQADAANPAMRVLFAFLLLAALAVLAALLFKLNTGYALFVAPPYRVEISLNAFIVCSRSRLRRLPPAAAPRGADRAPAAGSARGRRRRNVERARGKQDAAVVALLEGRYGKARQFAEEALAIPQSTGLPALVGARAAVDMREFDAAEAFLARPDARRGSLTVPRLMLEADMALEQGQPGEALSAARGDLKREAGLHTAALRLEVRALHRGGPLRRDPAARRPARQAQGLRRRRRATCCAPARMRRR